MRKLTKQVLTGVVALGLLAPVATSSLNPIKTTVNAKRHHRRLVRNHYYYKHHAPKGVKGFWLLKHKHHMYYGLSFQNTGVAWIPDGAPLDNWNKPKYKYAGHNSYLIKPSRNSHNTANYLKDSGELGEHYYVRVRPHHHILVWANGHYIGNYHKVSRKVALSRA